jgi:hypothetical protein
MEKPTVKGDRKKGSIVIPLEHKLRFLTPRHIAIIDEMLASVAPYGEVTLRIQQGKLRFVAQSKSFDATKMQRPRSSDETKESGGGKPG